MSKEIRIDLLPGSETRAKIGKINVNQGDLITEGEIILVLEGGKCSGEFKSEYEGRILTIDVEEGDEVHFSVEWFDNDRGNCSMPKGAWHSIEEGMVEKIGNLPDVLSKCMAHPFGGGTSKPYEIV